MSIYLTLKNEDEVGSVLLALEAAVQDCHQTTCEVDPDDPDYEEAAEAMRMYLRLIRRLDGWHGVLSAPPQPGVPFDWDAYWEDDDESEEAEEKEADAPEEEPSPAPCASEPLGPLGAEPQGG